MGRKSAYDRLCQWVLPVPIGLGGLGCLLGGSTDPDNGTLGRLAAAAIGLLLLALAAGLASGWLPHWLTELGAPPSHDDVIALRFYRFARRKPYLELRDGALLFLLPRYFGSRPWVVPVNAIAVSLLDDASGSEPDLTPEPAILRDAADGVEVDDRTGWSAPPTTPTHVLKHSLDDTTGVVLQTRVVIPYLATTSDLAEPTVLMLFTEPQRIPPVRPFVAHSRVDLAPYLGYFSSRSARGTLVDGVMLRVTDPETALAQLVSAGAHHREDPLGWLSEHRPLSTDPVERTMLIGRERRTARMRGTAEFMIFIGLVGNGFRAWLGYHGDRISVLLVALLLGGLVLRWVAWWLGRARKLTGDDQV